MPGSRWDPIKAAVASDDDERNCREKCDKVDRPCSKQQAPLVGRQTGKQPSVCCEDECDEKMRIKAQNTCYPVNDPGPPSLRFQCSQEENRHGNRGELRQRICPHRLRIRDSARVRRHDDARNDSDRAPEHPLPIKDLHETVCQSGPARVADRPDPGDPRGLLRRLRGKPGACRACPQSRDPGGPLLGRDADAACRDQGPHWLPEAPRDARVAHHVGSRRRRFHRNAPNQLWLTDVTEHPTREGKVYCAVVLDAFSRRVVGWSISHSPTAALTTQRARNGDRAARRRARQDGHP